jgi:hypothetical protein
MRRENMEIDVTKLSSKELEAMLKVKKQVEGVDLNVLEHFGIDPKKYTPDQLRKLSKAGAQSIRDGRAMLSDKYTIRTHALYTLFLTDMKKTHGVNGQQLLTAIIEAILAGDLQIERTKIPKTELHNYQGNKYRVKLTDKNGFIINTSNYKDRPEGVTL